MYANCAMWFFLCSLFILVIFLTASLLLASSISWSKQYTLLLKSKVRYYWIWCKASGPFLLCRHMLSDKRVVRIKVRRNETLKVCLCGKLVSVQSLTQTLSAVIRKVNLAKALPTLHFKKFEMTTPLNHSVLQSQLKQLVGCVERSYDVCSFFHWLDKVEFLTAAPLWKVGSSQENLKHSGLKTPVCKWLCLQRKAHRNKDCSS